MFFVMIFEKVLYPLVMPSSPQLAILPTIISEITVPNVLLKSRNISTQYPPSIEKVT